MSGLPKDPHKAARARRKGAAVPKPYAGYLRMPVRRWLLHLLGGIITDNVEPVLTFIGAAFYNAYVPAQSETHRGRAPPPSYLPRINPG